MSRPYRLVGFDIETSGSDRNMHVVLQVGACDALNPLVANYVSDVGHRNWLASEEAQAIHRISPLRTLIAPPTEQIDAELLGFLDLVNPKGRCIAVGWNVGLFDIAFIARDFPQSANKFGYRTCDLNALCFTAAQAWDMLFDDVKTLAKAAGEHGAAGLNRGDAHDALCDAVSAAFTWQWFCNVLASGPKRAVT